MSIVNKEIVSEEAFETGVSRLPSDEEVAEEKSYWLQKTGQSAPDEDVIAPTQLKRRAVVTKSSTKPGAAKPRGRPRKTPVVVEEIIPGEGSGGEGSQQDVDMDD